MMRQNSVIPRACKNCRTRKIRCNRQNPCSNCVTSNLQCPSTGPVLPAKESRAPPSVADNIDQIAVINARLERLEKALESSLPNHCNRRQERPQDGETFPADVRGSSETEWFTCQAESLRGESSFEGQADMASRISQLPSIESTRSSQIVEEVRSLHEIIHNQETGNTPPQKALPGVADNYSQQLPVRAVVKLLEVLKKPFRLLFVMHPIEEPRYLERLAQRIYFPVAPISTGELTVFYGLLYNHVREIIEVDKVWDMPLPELRRYQDVCFKAFQAGVQSCELYAVPTHANTLALTIAILDAQFTGNLALQWDLTSAAARHCITLAYHREATMQKMSAEMAKHCRRVFWHVYVSSQSMVLPLGKAPMIHDYDVDLDPTVATSGSASSAWSASFDLMRTFFSLQASVYQRLYSPLAKNLGSESRVRTVQELSADLERWFDRWLSVDHSQAHHSELFHVLFIPVHVAYYSLLALIHRAATSSSSIEEVSEECFTSARKGLQTHLSLYPQVAATGTGAVQLYAIWVFIRSSFTPYIVTFVHCISHTDKNDLDTLREVLSTLDEIAIVAHHCQRQVEVCKALYRTAHAFIHSNQSAAQQAQAHHERTISLPLQHYDTDLFDWDLLQSDIDSWVADGMSASAVTLGIQLDGSTQQ